MEAMTLELKNMFVLKIALYLVFTVELKKSEKRSLDRFVFCPNPSHVPARSRQPLAVLRKWLSESHKIFKKISFGSIVYQRCIHR